MTQCCPAIGRGVPMTMRRHLIAMMLAAVVPLACVPADQIDPTAAADGDGDIDLTEGQQDGKFDGPGSTPGTQLVLRGTVITMDEQLGTSQVVEDGAVVIVGGKIKQVLAAGEPLPSGAGVTVLPSVSGASDWVITPGLINLHNHLAYNTAHIYRDLPLYENTYQWRDEKYYDSWIQYPKRVFGDASADPGEFGLAPINGKRVSYAGLVGRYAEVKELVSGTTSTQGSYFGSLMPSGYGLHAVRNVDANNFGQKRISQASLGVLVPTFDPRPLVDKMVRGSLDAWLVHLLEGTDQESRDEFDCLKAMGLVRKELVLIHGTALTKPQLQEMARVGAKLVTSPVDNLMYYGQTPDIVSAWKLGVNVSLGTDWSAAGSKNLLSELKTLDALNRLKWRRALADRDLVQMVTTNPADAIGWTRFVGRIRPGLIADLAVYTKRSGSAYRSIIDATEKDVRLVMVGGDPLYGDLPVMETLKPSDHEKVIGCAFEKAIDITTTDKRVEYGALGLAEVQDALAAALQFTPEWMAEHYDPAREGGWTGSKLTSQLKSKFPLGLASRTLDPMFVCEDANYVDALRTDPNIRTSNGGLCLDLRTKYGTNKRSACGGMPAQPPLLTVEEHPGTVPARPAAWCAGQVWNAPGDLPKPPR